MKIVNHLLLILLFTGAFLTSCQKEIVEPVTDDYELSLQGRAGHIYPDQACGPSRTGTIADLSGNVYGSTEIMNDEVNVYVLISMHNGFFLESLFANFGTTADIPVDGNTMVMEDFMFQDYIQGGKTIYTVIFPTAALPVCNDVVLHANVSERNVFGQTLAIHDTWMGANPVYNGYFYKYCLARCN